VIVRRAARRDGASEPATDGRPAGADDAGQGREAGAALTSAPAVGDPVAVPVGAPIGGSARDLGAGRERGLEAPHRRASGGSRVLEKATVRGYRAAAWLLSRLPAAPAWTVIGWFTRASYLLWPMKRRWSDANFRHVLGNPRSNGPVRRLALRAYGHYARYLVELMRLPSLSAEARATLVEPEGIADLEDIWRSSDGVILVAGHVGNNEACAAGVASRGWPISAVADDSSFPEMFDLLRRQRGEWGVTLIPWRNLRAVYAVLRRKEMLALLIDWGYRSDGIPVRLFDAWTTLPAGPASLAAKTGATIVPVTIRRLAEGRFRATLDAPIHVPSSAQADVQRATQAMADALQRSIAAAPDQWYSFKPMWPDTVEEEAALEARAVRMLAEPA
jgi:phosphatidylinositol dimannoside acyltransferase